MEIGKIGTDLILKRYQAKNEKVSGKN